MSKHAQVTSKTAVNQGAGKGGPKNLSVGDPVATGKYVGFDVAEDCIVSWTVRNGAEGADPTVTDMPYLKGASPLWDMTDVSVSQGRILLILE
jgi:hypothetical protein